ncbi:MAG: hypothetical protein AB7I19_11975 [Planctomycetota bacterium]
MIYNLIHVPIQVLPEVVKSEFEAALKACTSTATGKQGSAQASIARMSEHEASEHAQVAKRTLYYVPERLRELGS